MGIRGPEFHGTGNIESIVEWYVSLKMEPPEVSDSVTFEASLYSYNRKTLKTMRPWRDAVSRNGCPLSQMESSRAHFVEVNHD